MDISRIDDFKGGWFIGSFAPTLDANPHFEVCLKRYKKGSTEPTHYQKLATEFTVIVSGTARMGGVHVGPDDIVRIPPGEAADFEALEDVVLLAIKTPSIPQDKFLGLPA